MRRGNRAARLVRDDRGQVFVFVVTIVFALFLFAATSINIGQAVIRRVLLQQLADAGAFTGATVMAEGLNTLAQQNKRIQQAWAGLADATLGFTEPPCPVSDLATVSYSVARANLGRLIGALNTGYGQRADGEARRVTNYNAVDLFPSERLSMGESHGPSGLSRQRPISHLVDLEEVPNGTATAPDVPAVVAGYSRRIWTCWTPTIPPVVLPRRGAFALWYRAMQSSMPISFVWVVSAPPVKARVFDQFFGPWTIPEMTAAAVARPVGGEIKNGRTNYVAKMTPLGDLRGQIFDSVFLRMRAVHH